MYNENRLSATRSAVRRRFTAIWALLVAMGPGIITSNVDNDAGGIATYSLAGANFGLQMLWYLIPITLLLIVVQEVSARLAVVSGKGLSDLIRERYGVKFTFYTMVIIVLTNLGNEISDFAGIAASLEIFGISRYIAIPLSMIFLMWLVVKGTYRFVERAFLTACVFYVAYLLTGFLVGPDWVEVVQALGAPTFRMETSFVVMLVGLTGTTIAPWMMFYLQSSIVDKGLGISQLKAARLDVTIGSVAVSVVAFFIVLTCAATLFKSGIKINEAADAALALEPLAGRYCSWLFAFGLFSASMFAASILPLSTAYTVCEAFGWESSLNKKFSEAPQFYSLYCFIVLISGLFILVPSLPLVSIMFMSQVLNGIVLPVVLVFMFLLVNDKGLMKDHANGWVLNAISWVALVILIGLSVVTTFFLFTGANAS